MKTRSNMPLFVLECSDVKALSNSQIDLLRCGDYLVKKDASGEHAYKVTFKSDTGMCLTYHDASVIETQSYDWNNSLKKWVYNSEDKTPNLLNIPMKLEDITDKDGHKRFIEGDITMETISGVTQTYGKWSLSGTHLLIVVGGSVANETALVYGTLANVNLPQWIKDKIVSLGLNIVDTKSISLIGNDNTTQNLGVQLRKETNVIYITNSSLTLTKDRNFVVRFDLLIDNE